MMIILVVFVIVVSGWPLESEWILRTLKQERKNVILRLAENMKEKRKKKEVNAPFVHVVYVPLIRLNRMGERALVKLVYNVAFSHLSYQFLAMTSKLLS